MSRKSDNNNNSYTGYCDATKTKSGRILVWLKRHKEERKVKEKEISK